MRISYDEEADVLYITIRETEMADTENIGNGVLVRRDMETDEIVGYTIMHFSEKTGEIQLPGLDSIPA